MKEYLGIELGSTRIKGVVINGFGEVKASGSYTWENKQEFGYWTYSESDIRQGLKECCEKTLDDYENKYGNVPDLNGMGISAMMHGYIVLDENDQMLVPFRTWRNNTTEEAAKELSEAFGFNMPQRWSAVHLYQSILNGEPHVNKVKYLTTLSGYVHYLLTGNKVLGIDDASGMFPVNAKTKDYDSEKLSIFNERLKSKGINYKYEEIAPGIMVAGEVAGYITEEGAKLLDSKRRVKAGTTTCPPEGDAGTGMVATNSVKTSTGNVSAGTSAFVMVVLDKPMSKPYEEIDIVSTPDGKDVAMIHASNCTFDINAWTELLKEAISLFAKTPDTDELFTKLFTETERSDDNVGGIVNYNYGSSEFIAGIEKGRPMLLRGSGSVLTLANFMKSQIYSAVAPLNLGINIFKKENVGISEINGHGGFFSTPKIGASAMSAALDAPITVLKNAGEGGAWGIALLSAFVGENIPLADFLDRIFMSAEKETTIADEREKIKFNNFMKRYISGLKAERLAGKLI